jgi:hypothetical protein
MNPNAQSCCKENGKPALVAFFYLRQVGKSEQYCARQISQALSRTFPARSPQKTNKRFVPVAVGAATGHNPERQKVANAINNPIWILKRKHAKERMMFGCLFVEFAQLTIQEQQSRVPGFTQLSRRVMFGCTYAGGSAEEKKKLNTLAVKQMEGASSMTLQTAQANVESQLQEALLALKDAHGCATRSRAPGDPPRARHKAGYRSQ